MDLHGIVSGAVGVINPQVYVTVKVSTGYATATDGARVATYVVVPNVLAQVQPLEYGDIEQADALNIQGVRRKIYMRGALDGLVRSQEKGGDLVVMADGTTWKVALVTEHWPDWTAAIITLQNT